MHALIVGSICIGGGAFIVVFASVFASLFSGRAARATAAFIALAALVILFALIGAAHAAVRMEIPGLVQFTDERGDCPRNHRVAIAPNGMRGCWTMDDQTHDATVTWPTGSVLKLSAMQIDIYAKDVP